MKHSLILILTIAAVIMAGSQASAISLGIAGDYNAFIFEDFSATGSNTQGRLAAGGNVSLSGHGVGTGLSGDTPGTTDTLVAGGDLSMGNWSQIMNGNAVLGGTADLPAWYSMPHGSISENTAPTLAWDAAATALTGLAKDLADLTVTGSVHYEPWGSPRGAMAFSGDGINAVQVFDVDGGLWSSTHSFSFEHNRADAPENATFIFNISGTDVSMQNAGMGAFSGALGDSYDNVVFNFYEATSLAISGIQVEGSILAPLAQVTASGGQINGIVVARSFTGDGMGLNHRPFEASSDPGPVTPVPEPGTLVLLACSLLLISGLLRQNNKV